MREALSRLIGLGQSLLLQARNPLYLGGVLFLSTFYVWDVVVVQEIAGNPSALSEIPLGLVPSVATAAGMGVCVLLVCIVKSLKRRHLLRLAVLTGAAVDVASYLTLGPNSAFALEALYLQLVLALLGLSVLYIGSVRTVEALGLLSLILPWSVVPVCIQVSVCGTVEQAQTPPALTPVLAVQGYSGYNIILYNDTYYAILQSEGPFSVAMIESGGYSNYFVGNSIQQVEQEINASRS